MFADALRDDSAGPADFSLPSGKAFYRPTDR